MMSRREVKQEIKRREGDPLVRRRFANSSGRISSRPARWREYGRPTS